MRLVDADELLEILRIMQEVYFDRKIILGKVVEEVKRMPTIEPDWGAIWDSLSKVYNMKDVPDEAKSIIGDLMLSLDWEEG